MEANEVMLCEEIKSEFETLKTLQLGSEQHSEAVQSLERLIKLDIESKKVKAEAAACEREEAHRKKEHLTETILKGVGIGVSLIGIGAPICYGVWVADRGFKFEETGTYISQTLRNVLPWFKPKM